MFSITFTIFKAIIILLGNFNFVSNWKLDHIAQHSSQITLSLKGNVDFHIPTTQAENLPKQRRPREM